jgi:hypothetical protein
VPTQGVSLSGHWWASVQEKARTAQTLTERSTCSPRPLPLSLCIQQRSCAGHRPQIRSREKLPRSCSTWRKRCVRDHIRRTRLLSWSRSRQKKVEHALFRGMHCATYHVARLMSLRVSVQRMLTLKNNTSVRLHARTTWRIEL